MRLDKFLVDCGVGSRSQVKNFLKKKQVIVNGQVETSNKTQIDENEYRITYFAQELTRATFVYTQEACGQNLSGEGGWCHG